MITNTLPDAATTADIQHCSRRDKTTQILKDDIDKWHILQHHAKQLANYKHIFHELLVKNDAKMTSVFRIL